MYHAGALRWCRRRVSATLVLRVRSPRAPATALSGERWYGKVAAVAQTRQTIERSASNEALRLLLCCLAAFVLAAFVKAPRVTGTTAKSYLRFASFGGVILENGKLTAHFPKFHDRRYEMILSGGTCSASALGAGLIVISPKDWVLDGGLRANTAFSMPRSGHLLLLDLRDPRHSRFLACADLPS